MNRLAPLLRPTIRQVELDLGPSVFAYGQAYVGLSRTTSLKQHLSLTEFHPKSFMADPTCVQFYREAERRLGAGEETRECLAGVISNRMRASASASGGLGLRRFDDTTLFGGTAMDSWDEMAMGAIADCITYCCMAELRKTPGDEGESPPYDDDESAVLRMVRSGAVPIVSKLVVFWSALDKRRGASGLPISQLPS